MNQDIVVYLKAQDQMTGQLKKASSEISRFESAGNKAANGLSSAWKALGVAIPAAALAMAARQAIAIADNYTNLHSRLKLVTSSEQELAAAEQSLFNIANQTRQTYESTVDLYTKVSRATKELGISDTERLAITEKVNQALIISGTSQENAKAGLQQMTQALQGGVVRAEEYNSMMENTPRILEAVADGWEGGGITLGQLRQKMLEGKLTAKDFLDAFERGGAGIQAEFSQMSVTVSQALTVLDNAYKDIISDANEGSGATDGIAQSVLNLADTINQNRDGILSLLTEMINLAGQVVSAFANIGQSIQGARAVASGELSFLEYATSDAAELKQALKDIVPGMKEVDAELDTLAAKRREVAESWAFTPAARKAKEEELKAIDESIDALKVEKNALEATKDKYVDTWQTAKKEVESTTPVVKKHFGTVKVESDKSKKEHIKSEKEKTKATKDEVENRNTYYERYGIAERAQIESIKDSWQLMEEGKVEALARANDEIVDSTQDTTNVFVDEWSNAMSSIQSSIADMIYEFDFSMDSILDIFKRMLAEMLAAIIMSGIKDALIGMFGGSGGFLGGLFGSGTGGGGGGLGSLFGGGASGPATSGWGQIGGGLALAGGAYGMYSGARNIGRGNTGTGVMQAGLGAASAYQGAVTLGLIESGTATALAQSAAAQLGINVGSTVGASGAGHASIAAAQSSLLSSGGTGATSTVAPAWQGSYLASQPATSTAATSTASTAGSGGMAAGAAAGLTYATVAAAAILVATGAIAKANRPSASAQIDEAGITPEMLGQFYNGMSAVQGSILATVPTLAKYETAQYNAEHSLLALTSSTSTLALKYDETAPAGHRWSKALAAGSTALHQAIKDTYKFGESLGYADGEINTSLQAMETEIESVQALTYVMSGAADAADSMENSVSGLTSATQSLENATGSADNQVLGFSQMIVGLGGAAGSAAKNLGEAIDYISGSIGVYNAPGTESMENHAIGGIFPGITRWGSHIIGEKGTEALIPLPYGPDTFDKLFKKLDSVKGGGQAIHNHIYLDGREIATYVKQIDADLQSRGFSRLAA